jgi:hypothetical protein
MPISVPLSHPFGFMQELAARNVNSGFGGETGHAWVGYNSGLRRLGDEVDARRSF